jgi:hypothetical protein
MWRTFVNILELWVFRKREVELKVPAYVIFMSLIASDICLRAPELDDALTNGSSA